MSLRQLSWLSLPEACSGGMYSGVPRMLPALIRATRIQQKAATVGFDWEKPEDAWEKVEEEISELKQALSESREKVEEEFGDLLFALVNYSRFIKINSEDALRAATEKFIRRFKMVEEAMERSGRNMEEASLQEMDEVWNRIKHQKRREPNND